MGSQFYNHRPDYTFWKTNEDPSLLGQEDGPMTESEIATLREFARTAESNMNKIWDKIENLQTSMAAINTKQDVADARREQIFKKLDEVKLGQENFNKEDSKRDDALTEINSKLAAIGSRLTKIETSASLNWKWIMTIGAALGGLLQIALSFMANHFGLVGK